MLEENEKMTVDSALTLIADLLSTETKIFKDDIVTFLIKERLFGTDNYVDKKITLSITELKKSIDSFNSCIENEHIGLFTGVEYKIHAKVKSSRYYIKENIPFTLNDKENGIEYKIEQPTLDYILYYLLKTKDSRKISTWLITQTESIEEIKFCDFFINRLSSFFIITIKTEKKTSVEKMEKYLKGFLFQLSYNSNIILIPESSFNNDIFVRRKTGIRKNRLEEIEPPKRKYIDELVNHYQLGLSADSTYLKYLSFYHVFEHFFDSVFFANLREEIQKTITGPAFSCKKDKDLQALIKLISNRVKIQNNEMTSDEKTGLRLVFEKYLNLDDLRDSLNDISTNIIPYYKDNKVSFSKGDVVDLNSTDATKIKEKLADRIYKTRCSLVHSKGFMEDKFTPFKNDIELNNEIPLLKLIAEQVIINSSELIK